MGFDPERLPYDPAARLLRRRADEAVLGDRQVAVRGRCRSRCARPRRGAGTLWSEEITPADGAVTVAAVLERHEVAARDRLIATGTGGDGAPVPGTEGRG
ncbi:hypothetical protein [Streptomyces sp. NPDC059491]|uniref:hypothetical protein n=1 Tax=Streptomyces sp. NPDC059491 TaxID=3346850 RepID=UPI0036741450